MRRISCSLYVFIILSLGQHTYIESSSTKSLITNPYRFDGFGAQFIHIIGSILYAECNNLHYIYTPFTAMEHNYDNNPEFLRKKEWLINFIDNFEINTAHDTKYPPHAIDFLESHIEECSNSQALQKVRYIFRANKNINDYFNNENLNIAVHIRRPNEHDSRVDGTDTPDNIFLNIINKLRIIYASKNPLFHIYSQGSNEDFQKFNAPDIILHLNTSLEDAYIPLVLADVLVASRSTFSYTAGILSEGIVYYIPFWHSPLPHWISVKTLDI